jgi:hypothetical protein
MSQKTSHRRTATRNAATLVRVLHKDAPVILNDADTLADLTRRAHPSR